MSSTTQRRSRLQHGYYIGVSHRSAQATAGKGLAQGPYVTARAGAQTTTLRLKVIASTNAPSRPTSLIGLIAHLPHFSHISFMTQQFHWLSFNICIEFKVLFVDLKYQLGSAPKYLCDHIQALSLSSLRSSQRHDLFMPHVRTTMAHTRPVAFIGP